MPADDFAAVAARIAGQIRAGGRGFVTFKKDELREAFGIGRMSQGLAEQVVQALDDVQLLVHPHPSVAGSTLRVYSQKHPIGQAAHAIVSPDEVTEAPLTALARIHERAQAGRDLRSDDVPWLDAFDILLQLAVGREPAGWEDVRDDRHGSMLAAELAQALTIEPAVLSATWFINLAAAVTSRRPRRRTPQPGELVGSPDAVSAGEQLARVLARCEGHLRDTYREALRAAALTVVHGREIPDSPVELGVLHLRRRIEEQE